MNRFARPFERALRGWNLIQPSLGIRNRVFLAIGLLSFVGGLLEAFVLLVVVRVAVAMTDGGSALKVGVGPVEGELQVGAALGLAAVALLLRLAVATAVGRLSATSAATAFAEARKRVVEAFTEASWEVQSADSRGHFQELMSNHVAKVSVLALNIGQAVSVSFNLGSMLLFAIVLDRVAAVVLVVSGLALAFSMRPLTRFSRRNADRSADRNVAFAAGVVEAVSLAREMRVFSVEPAVRGALAEEADAVTRPYFLMRFLGIFTPALYQFLALLLACGGLGLLFALQPAGGAGFGSVGVVVLILVRSLSYGQQLQSVQHHMNEMAPYVEGVAAEQRRYLDAAESWGEESLERIGRIDLEGVVYAYEPGRPVLHGVDLSIAPCETVGIVGPSGGGKSTVTQLILGLRRPVSGSIRVDGKDLYGVRRVDFYRRVAFVPQDSTVFDGTVHDNIRFYRDGVDRSDVERAAQRAHLHDEILALPDGYDSMVSDTRGALSGGQRQRLFIARALLGDPELLVLDEPTSALDLKSDALVQETLEALHGQITMVIIAHRLSTLRFCDRLIVVKAGRIEATGDAGSLVNDSAFYREAVELSELS